MTDKVETSIFVARGDCFTVCIFERQIAIQNDSLKVKSQTIPEDLGEIAAVVAWGKQFVLAHSSKLLSVWLVDEQSKATCTSRCGPFAKRLMVLQNLPECDTVLVGDAVGDIFTVCLAAASEPKLSFGHMSSIAALSSLTYGKDKKIMVASGDKDGKIRVAPFPAVYDITSFCLGHHTSLAVICLAFVGDRVLCASSDLSGDLLVHDISSGEVLGALQFAQMVSSIAVCSGGPSSIYIALDGEPFVIQLSLPSLEKVTQFGPFPGGVVSLISFDPSFLLVGTPQEPYFLKVALTGNAPNEPLQALTEALGIPQRLGTSCVIVSVPQAMREFTDSKRRRGQEDEEADT